MNTQQPKKIPTPKKPLNRVEKSMKKEQTIKKLPTPPSRKSTLQSKKNNKLNFWILLKIIIIILIWIFLWTQKESILSYIWWGIKKNELVINKNDDVLFVGKNIKLTWEINAVKSKKNLYRHSLNDNQYGLLWLRSSIIDLNQLSWEISIEWQIIDFIDNIYIVDVVKTSTQETESVNSWSNLIYFPNPWIIMQDMSRDGFTITNQESPTTSTISINNLSTKAQINIRYFTCSNDQAYNCKLFQDTFEKTVGVHFIDSYNNRFYKLKDENTWFVNLENNYGIYIETSNESLLNVIIPNIQFITHNWANSNISNIAKNLCTSWWYSLQEIINGTISKQENNLIRKLQWVSQNYETIDCAISFNPIKLESSQLISLNKKENNKTEEQLQKAKDDTIEEKTQKDNVENKELSLEKTNNIKQIPLKPWKELSFSTKWTNISFPSPNIAFASINTNTTVQWLLCNTMTNIVEYSNKIELSTNPAVIMYFCKPWNVESNSKFRIIETNNATILIELLNPSWVDFINAIKINQ